MKQEVRLFRLVLRGKPMLLAACSVGLVSLLFPTLPTHATATQSTLTMQITTGILTTSITPTPDGTFGKTASSAVSVSTDNYTGYTLSIKSQSSTSLLNHDNDAIESLGSAISEATFSSDSTYNNKWGYQPSQYVTSSGGVNTTVLNTDFLPAPSTTGDLLAVTTAVNSTADQYTLVAGARVDTTLPADTYEYAYVLMAVANDIVFNITYEENAGQDPVSNMPSPNPQPTTIDGGTSAADSYTTLSDATPVRNDWKFAGWCDVATGTDSETGNDTCSGTLYKAGDDFPIDQTDAPNITLYAVWVDTLFPIVWNQIGACEFHGNAPSNITGSECEDYWDVKYIDTGIALYSQQNADKDYEIHFKIDHFLISEQTGNDNQQTFVNDKVSTSAASSTIVAGEAPGIVVRRADSSIQFASKLNDEQERANISAATIVNGGGDVSVFRIDSKIYYSINGGPLVLLQDITGFDQYFGLTTWFGGYPSDGCTGDNGPCTNAKRFIEATMSNMYIRLGEVSDDDVHTVNFKKNDGTTDNEATYLIKDGNSITTLPATPTYTNHIFQGWFTAPTGGSQVTATTLPTQSVDYYAQWIGTVNAAVITNEDITLNPNATETINVTNSADLESYTFSSNNTGVATVNATTGEVTAVAPGATTIAMTGAISGEIKTINVTVQGATYTIEFDSQGGEAVSDITIGEGATINPLPSPTRSGYRLLGWFTGTDGTGTELTTSTVFSSSTPRKYYAYWEEVGYVCKVAKTLHTETCDAASGKGCRAAGFAANSTITYGNLIESTTRSYGDAYDCDINDDGVWDGDTERFYYIGTNNGNVALVYYKNEPGDQNYQWDPAIAALPDNTLWTNPGLVAQGTKVSRFMTVAEVTEICSGTTQIGYKIGSTDKGKCGYITESSTFAHAADTGYLNTIWLDRVNGANRRVNLLDNQAIQSPAATSQNGVRPVIEVPANMIQPYTTAHTITFDPQNGGNTTTVTVDDGDTIGSQLPADPTYADHLFQRWYNTADDTTVNASTVPTGDMTVYAEWKGTVALAQVASNSMTIVEGNTGTVQVTNASDIEAFTCSSSNANIATVNASTCVVTGVAEGTATISITGDDSHETNSDIVTVTVLDPSSVYIISFDAHGGSPTPSDISVAAGSQIGAQLPSAPTYANHAFMGWFTSASGGAEVTTSTVPSGNTTYHAQWKLDVTQAVISNDLIMAVGDDITVVVSNSADLEPYTFSSEDTSIATVDANTGTITGVGAGTTNVIMTGTKSGLAKTLEVQVNPVTHRVTFNANGGTAPTPYATVDVEDGEAVGNLPTTTKTNYMFFGWYKDDGTFYEEVYPNETIDDDVTFYAKWVEDTSGFPIVWAVTNACTFNGSSRVTGDYCLIDEVSGNSLDKTKNYLNTGIALFSSTNKDKDFEVGFNIVTYNAGSQVATATLVASKAENISTNPGFVIRREASTDNIQYTERYSFDSSPQPQASTSSVGLHQVRLRKIDGIMYYSWNNSAFVQARNISANTTIFDTMVWFGATVNSAGTGSQRPLSGVLTDMYVKLGAPTDYIINFDAGSGSLVNASEGTRNVTIDDPLGTLPAVNPPSEDFTFAGWWDDSVSPAVQVSASTVPDGNKTYKAHYSYNSSDEPVVFDVSNDATRGYQTLISGWVGSPVNITTFNKASPINSSTWGDTSELSELEFWTDIRDNFIDNECFIQTSTAHNTNSDAVKPLSGLSNWTSGSVDCSKPDAYDTKIGSALNVYLDDENGEQVAYVKAENGVIHNMIPGQTYYWEDQNDSTVYGYVTAVSNGSSTGTRWVDTDVVRNVRDLGGLPVTYTDSNSQTVTGTLDYGRLFRGEKLQNVNASEFTNLGITTEYNVGDEYSTDTHLSDYHLNQVVHYDFAYHSGDENNASSNYMKAWTAVTNIMTDVVAGKNVFFHCRVGADRTGTTAYLLEGLLGVPDEARYEEYELTNVSGLYDRTRYYKQKASNNANKFVFMMDYVKTTQDIYDWYTHNPNASDSLIQSFRTAMTVPSGGNGGGQQQQNASTQQASPFNLNGRLNYNSNNTGSNSDNDGDNTNPEGTEISDKASSDASTDSFNAPLGVSEGNDDTKSPSAAGLAIAVAAAAASGVAVTATAVKQHSTSNG